MRIHERDRWLWTLVKVGVALLLVALIVDLVFADAAGILKGSCYKCHGTERDDWDASDILSAFSMKEKILEMIEEDQMPPDDLPKLSEADKELVRQWFAGQPPQRRVLDDAWVLEKISLDQYVKADSLYLSLSNLYNSGATRQEIWNAQAAVAKAANMLSTSPQIVLPKRVDKEGIVLRLDVYDLAWTDIEAAALLEAYPYLNKGFIRGDWFVARAIMAPLYYELLGMPDTQEELDLLFGIDRKRFIRNNLVRRAVITNSRVAFHNRAIEWAPANTGAVRITYDVQDEKEDRNLVANPLGGDDRFTSRGFTHDAVEYIADMPNGLHLYAAINGKGKLVDKVPENIASDPQQRSGSTSIVPGVSCVSCHQTGINLPVDDVVLDGAPAFSVGDLAKVQAIFAPKDEFSAILKDDEERYVLAASQATKPFKAEGEPIGSVALAYNKPVSLAVVAMELGVTEESVRNAISIDGDLQVLGLGPLLNDRTITRETYEGLDSGQSPAIRLAQLIGG